MTVDRSQDNVLTKITAYLRSLGRDQKVIDQFKQGYCVGITSLWLYAKWLSFHTKSYFAWFRYMAWKLYSVLLRQYARQDDYVWFESTVDLIASWDEKSELSVEAKGDFERFISYIQFFQHARMHVSIAKQSDLDKILEDTKGRRLKKEYSIASLFTLEQLKQLLNAKNVIQEGRLVLISSHDHTTALFREKNYYYYFDSNSRFGEFKSESLDKVAELIFDANFYGYYVNPSPLSFKIFSFDEFPAKTYPSQHEILTKLEPVLFGNDDVENYTGLIIAAEEGCLESVRYFLKRGGKEYFNAQLKDGTTALTVAVQYGYIDIVREILKKDLNLDHLDKEGDTVLMLAVKNKRIELVKLLLKHGANPDIQNVDKETALMQAVLDRRLDIIDVLLEYGADPNILVVNNWSVLMMAVVDNDIVIIKKLLTKDLDLDLRFESGDNVLMYALSMGYVDVAREFLRQGFNLDAKNENGWTALMFAVIGGYVDIVSRLLSKNADPNVKNKNGWTAFMLAVAGGNVDIVREFLKEELNVLDRKSDLVLKLAADSGQLEVIRLLFDFNEKKSSDQAIFMWAAKKGYLKLFKQLLKRGVDPNISDEYRKTALMLAAKEGNFDIVEELLISKVDVNVQDEKGWTALMYAVASNHFNIVKKLLGNGADPGIMNKNGKNAFLLAENADVYKALGLDL